VKGKGDEKRGNPRSYHPMSCFVEKKPVKGDSTLRQSLKWKGKKKHVQHPGVALEIFYVGGPKASFSIGVKNAGFFKNIKQPYETGFYLLQDDCICIYVNMYTYIDMYVCMYTHTYIYIHICILVYIYM